MPELNQNNEEKLVEKKRGKLSLDERQFIEKNCGRLSVQQIAEEINRNVEPVKRFIRENNLTYVRAGEDSLYGDLREKLRERSYWKELEQQFTKNELEMFEARWVDLMKQFQENVFATEEYQIKQYITIEILCHRSMVCRKQAIDDIERFQTLINEEMRKPEPQGHMMPISKEFRDWSSIDNWQNQIGLAKTTQQAYTVEFNKLLGDSQKLLKDLKATREQRLHRIEESRTTWNGLIKMLEEEEVREREGIMAGLMRKSTKKTYDKYSEVHKYQDGQYDLPILNSDTISKYDKEDLNKQGDENGSEEDSEKSETEE